MKEIKLWEIVAEGKNGLDVNKIEDVSETETENQLEEVITKCPELLMIDLKLVGRQTDTPGGPLDLLGVDGDGRLVVFELKRGTLTRGAVAQIIDYSSYLNDMDIEDLSKHISERSGNLGIEKIDNFLTWYQEQFGKSFSGIQRPAMVLVGLGVDDKTRRMVSFLADSEIDISLVTFHGFKKHGKTLLAKQVEVQSKSPSPTTAYTKKANLEKLKQKVIKLSIDNFYYDIASFFRDQLAAYEWPNPGGYSYSLPELIESGSESNRVYIALYIYDNQPGRVNICLYQRAIEASEEAFKLFKDKCSNKINIKKDGNVDIWINSSEEWDNLKPVFQTYCPDIVSGWKKKREKQSSDEFMAAAGESLEVDNAILDESEK